jgi:DNA-binding winged helix-turn-helix (wHTH) protein
MLHYGSATFDPDLLTARRDDGLTVRFTRSERLLLKYMVENPGRLLSRNQLLDAISEPGSDKSDRTIDFIITRLRTKLNDDAANPNYIATRYGEGYVWVARTRKAVHPAKGAWLMLGPVRKLGRLPANATAPDAFLTALQSELATRFGPGRHVAIDPDCPPVATFPADPPRYSIELTFVPLDTGRIDCVAAIHHFATGKLIRVRRTAIDPADAAAATASQIATEIWNDELHEPNQHQPMVVRLSQAGLAVTGDPNNWSENDTRLRALLAEAPDDPVLRLLYATNLQSRHVIGGPAFFLGPFDIDADDREVEAIVTDILPHIQNDPVHAMSAARLLFHLGPAYRPLAIELAERSHREGTAIAASFGTIGHMRACLGDIDAGIEAYDIALGMTEPGSQYDLFLLVLKAQAQLAANLREDLAQTLATLYSRRPEIAFFMEVFCSPVGQPSQTAQMALAGTPPEMATAMLRYVYHSCTHGFVQPDHRLNTIEAGARLYVGQFGPSVMPPELMPEFGHLVG